jgi:hypothetical protein
MGQASPLGACADRGADACADTCDHHARMLSITAATDQKICSSNQQNRQAVNRTVHQPGRSPVSDSDTVSRTGVNRRDRDSGRPATEVQLTVRTAPVTRRPIHQPKSSIRSACPSRSYSLLALPPTSLILRFFGFIAFGLTLT